MSISRRQSGESRRNSNAPHSAAASQDDAASARSGDAHINDEPAEEEHTVMGGVFDGIASALGFGSSRVDDEEEGATGGRSRRSFSSHRSRSRPLLGRRSSSRSQAHSEAVSTEDGGPLSDGDDNWGYSSNEDFDSDRSSTLSRRSFDSDNNDLLPPSSRPHSPSSPSIMPLQSSDPVFQGHQGETQKSSTEGPRQFASTEGSKSKQVIILPDEDLSILFIGYATLAWKEFLWWIGCLLSAGILGLVGRWVPRLWVGWVGLETEFVDEKRNQWILVEVSVSSSSSLVRVLPY